MTATEKPACPLCLRPLGAADDPALCGRCADDYALTLSLSVAWARERERQPPGDEVPLTANDELTLLVAVEAYAAIAVRRRPGVYVRNEPTLARIRAAFADCGPSGAALSVAVRTHARAIVGDLFAAEAVASKLRAVNDGLRAENDGLRRRNAQLEAAYVDADLRAKRSARLGDERLRTFFAGVTRSQAN